LEQVQIDAIVRDIEVSFGPETPFSDKSLTKVELDSLESVFGDAGFQEYLQDQVHRQIIRDYLTNAVLLDCIDETGFSSLLQRASTIEGRSSLSLHMLMRSVEEAKDIPVYASQGEWRLLRDSASTRPQLELIPG